MIKFNDWEEFEWFLDNYCNFSCFNCTYGGSQGEPSQFLFCMRTISMVDLNMISLCTEWKSDNGKSLEDYKDCEMYTLPDVIIDKLNDGTMTISDLKTYGVNYEEFEESESG